MHLSVGLRLGSNKRRIRQAKAKAVKRWDNGKAGLIAFQLFYERKRIYVMHLLVIYSIQIKLTYQNYNKDLLDMKSVNLRNYNEIFIILHAIYFDIYWVFNLCRSQNIYTLKSFT